MESKNLYNATVLAAIWSNLEALKNNIECLPKDVLTAHLFEKIEKIEKNLKLLKF